MNIVLVAGARPNFMKIAPIMDALKSAKDRGEELEFKLIHTGQHYDEKMSSQFFDQLGIPKPDVNLEVGSGSHAVQTAAIMIAFEKFLTNSPTDLVIVVGDVNSTMAATIVAKKMNVKVAHVEAGIRSCDMKMPEEINRLVTDSICDYFYTTSKWAGDNLIRTGVDPDRIYFVGNTMIDTLLKNKPKFIKPEVFDVLGLYRSDYLVVTLHRPSNVDDEKQLGSLLQEISAVGLDKKVIFPCHPRTRKKIEQIEDVPNNIYLLEPMGYLEFMFLVSNAYAVVTDSGGIQEETTVLGIPCMTLRDNTERPETVEIGTNELIGSDPSKLSAAFSKLKEGAWKKGEVPELWDGEAAHRIVESVLKL